MIKEIEIRFSFWDRFFGFVFIVAIGIIINNGIKETPLDGTTSSGVEKIWIWMEYIYVGICLIMLTALSLLLINTYLKKGRKIIIFEGGVEIPTLFRMMTPYLKKEIFIPFSSINQITQFHSKSLKSLKSIKIESNLGSFEIFESDIVNKDDFNFLICLFKEKNPASFVCSNN